MKPGFLSEFGELSFRTTLGSFGKGSMAPPPGPPPGPATFRDDRWECPGNKPESDATSYYTCCPSGWTKANHGVTRPCTGEDRDLMECGPKPPQGGDLVCCPSMVRWVLRSPDGSDPCPAAREIAPGLILSPEEILGDDLNVDAREDSLVSPGLMVALGGAVFLGFGLVLFTSMRKH